MSITLNPNSVKYLDSVFKQYTEVKDQPKHFVNPIIHLYPVKETFGENGELNGFIDSFLCKVRIYDPKNLIFWESPSLHDALTFIEDVPIHQFKAFKDGSSMLAVRGNFKIFSLAQEIILKVSAS